MDQIRISQQHRIMECISGSRACGTSTPTSDTDYRGLFIGVPESILTPFYPVEQVEGPGDRVLYEIGKFLKLAADQNPNILELLWVRESDVLFTTPWYQALRDIRGRILSTKARHTFGGYAHAQMKRLKNAADQVAETGKSRPGRNPARAQLEQEHGYDTKHAMHLVRLLRMGLEVLQEGQLRVYRPDAAELLEIRDGKYSLAEILQMAEELDQQLAQISSDLPRSVDTAFLARHLKGLYLEYWNSTSCKEALV